MSRSVENLTPEGPPENTTDKKGKKVLVFVPNDKPEDAIFYEPGEVIPDIALTTGSLPHDAGIETKNFHRGVQEKTGATLIEPFIAVEEGSIVLVNRFKPIGHDVPIEPIKYKPLEGERYLDGGEIQEGILRPILPSDNS